MNNIIEHLERCYQIELYEVDVRDCSDDPYWICDDCLKELHNECMEIIAEMWPEIQE